MAELTVDDVAAYTRGRLDPDDPETARMLAAALDAARRHCGWHVTPVIADQVVTLDGPGSELLVLPTLALVELTAVSEDGIDLDVADLVWSTRGLVRKRRGTLYSGGPFSYNDLARGAVTRCWADQFSAITVTMTHGFDAAPWFDSAVLSYIDRTALCVGVGQRETVGPFSFAETAAAAGSAFTGEEQMVLDKYRLEWMP